jgi:hypothetical protein
VLAWCRYRSCPIAFVLFREQAPKLTVARSSGSFAYRSRAAAIAGLNDTSASAVAFESFILQNLFRRVSIPKDAAAAIAFPCCEEDRYPIGGILGNFCRAGFI